MSYGDRSDTPTPNFHEIEAELDRFRQAHNERDRQTYGCLLKSAVWRAINRPILYGDHSGLLGLLTPAAQALYAQLNAPWPNTTTRSDIKQRRALGEQFAVEFLKTWPLDLSSETKG